MKTESAVSTCSSQWSSATYLDGASPGEDGIGQERKQSLVLLVSLLAGESPTTSCNVGTLLQAGWLGFGIATGHALICREMLERAAALRTKI